MLALSGTACKRADVAHGNNSAGHVLLGGRLAAAPLRRAAAPEVSRPEASRSAAADASGASFARSSESSSQNAADAKPRLYVKNRFVFVRPRPDVNADWIGFLWFGASVALHSERPVGGPGCAAYYAIEPYGFVCVDDKQATLREDDPQFLAVVKYAPLLDRPAPHRYAESMGAVLLATLAGSSRAVPKLPAFFHEARRHLLPLSTVAYVDEETVNGQDWLLTADLMWLRKTDTKPYPEITFHGVELGGAWRLPLALFRQPGRPKFRRNAEGLFEKTSAEFELHEVVGLTEQSQVEHGERYLLTTEGDVWLRARDAVVPEPRSLTPWGARVGAEDRTGRAPNNGRHTWIEVSVLGGWLLAYEGTRAVYATLISPGRGGIPPQGVDTLEVAATPLGTFPISGKLATVTLQAPGEFLHSEVPWTQNFRKPYAIHVAYWHDNWGNPQSGGCINVSPSDGKWLFDFSEPALPPGWHAVRWRPALGAPTLLIVHE